MVFLHVKIKICRYMDFYLFIMSLKKKS